MISHQTTLKVNYYDTDQMGIVHHSNYVRYYEASRMDLLQNMGVSYKSIEEAGFVMPVTDVKLHYVKPAFYDEELIIETDLVSVKGPRVLFAYKIYNSRRQLINEGETTLAFVGKISRKPCHPPDFFTEALTAASQS